MACSLSHKKHCFPHRHRILEWVLVLFFGRKRLLEGLSLMIFAMFTAREAYFERWANGETCLEVELILIFMEMMIRVFVHR